MDKTISSAPSTPARYATELRRARDLADSGQVEQALVHLRQLVQEAPERTSGYLRIAALLRQEKRVQEARMVLESAVMYAPHCAALRKALTEICLETGRYDEVITQGQTLLALRPRSVFALDALVAAYIQQGRIERALKLLQERLRILPDDAWTHFQCGALWRHLGNHAEAIGALERALKAKDIEEVLAQNICSAIEMLDRPQIRQILVLASEDLHFRLAVQKNPTEAIKERGFYLSHAGLVALSELHWRDFPVSRWQHTRYGHH